MAPATGYGPSQAGQRWLRLLSDGDEKSYEVWEIRFWGVLLEGSEISADDDKAFTEDERKNGETLAELVQCLDAKGLSLVMTLKGWWAEVEILCEHDTKRHKPRVVSLDCELSSLRKAINKTVTISMSKGVRYWLTPFVSVSKMSLVACQTEEAGGSIIDNTAYYSVLV